MCKNQNPPFGWWVVCWDLPPIWTWMPLYAVPWQFWQIVFLHREHKYWKCGANAQPVKIIHGPIKANVLYLLFCLSLSFFLFLSLSFLFLGNLTLSHLSTHLLWNSWLHGRTRTTWVDDHHNNHNNPNNPNNDNNDNNHDNHNNHNLRRWRSLQLWLWSEKI